MPLPARLSAPKASLSQLLVRAGQRLALGQGALGRAIGVSRSTISRWTSRSDAIVGHHTIEAFARLVHPADPALAAEIAAYNGFTLSELGIAPPPPPVPAPMAPQPPVPLPPPPNPLVAETVLCAAAEVAGQVPAGVRPVVIAAFERADVCHLTVQDVLRGLRPAEPAKKAKG
jgi:hypothetical protein